MIKKPAIEGGDSVRKKVFPNISIPEGRFLGEEEKTLLSQVIDSGHLNRLGGLKMVSCFENEFSEMLKVPFCHAMTSGTASLHTAVASLNLDPGDEIITTTITDMGTIIAILMQQCIPIFADVCPESGNITAETIERQITEKTRAIIVVHLFGFPADMNSIMKLAEKYKLKVIEDSAQAYLAEYNNKYVGTMGHIGCFSLQQSKQITTGDGGVLITSDEELYRRAALFTDKAWPRTKLGDERGHLFLGVNYRMNELTGAVALAQLRKLKTIVEKRRKSADSLNLKLQKIKGIKQIKPLPGSISSWWMFPFFIDEKIIKINPSAFAKAMSAEGIPTGCGYISIPVFEYPVIKFRKTFGKSELPWSLPQSRKNISYDIADYPGSAHFLSKALTISWNEGISEEDVMDICKSVEKLASYYSAKQIH